VCGKYILPVLDDDYEDFSVDGIERLLQCHGKCKAALVIAGKDWAALPDGPLRRAFADAAEEADADD
jgi:hypothetical protein